ncbi:hypothetical protein PROVRETT_05951 [Providencia rettgeri DSM 1131]|nr:hypothetical protein PROVRETT_05951 [Providencia rettgeri DSM 1131]
MVFLEFSLLVAVPTLGVVEVIVAGLSLNAKEPTLVEALHVPRVILESYLPAKIDSDGVTDSVVLPVEFTIILLVAVATVLASPANAEVELKKVSTPRPDTNAINLIFCMVTP